MPISAILSTVVPLVTAHASEIVAVANVATTAGVGIFEKIKKRRQQKKGENLQIEQRIQELESGLKNVEEAALSIQEVQKQYFQCFEVLEENIKTIETNIDSISTDVQTIHQEIAALRGEQKQAKTGMIIMGVIGGIAIAASIVISILL